MSEITDANLPTNIRRGKDALSAIFRKFADILFDMKKIKRPYLICIIAVLAIIAGVIAIWSINNYQNEKWYKEEYAKIFDESMEASYPLLANSANALYMKASVFERNAIEANRYARNTDEFKEIFTQLNRQFSNTNDGQQLSYWLMQYDWFIPSLPCGRIFNGSELRIKESRAVMRIEYSRQSLKKWEDFEPDSLIRECQDIKVILNEAIRDLDKYRSFNQDVNAWRNIGPEDCLNLYDKYKSRKNWPFTFLNKD